MKSVKIWLDDIRPTPEGYISCKSVNECKEAITNFEKEGIELEVIDCDHDLGDYFTEGGDGIALIDWLIERDIMYPIEFHTANPVGRANMQRAIEAYYRRKNRE